VFAVDEKPQIQALNRTAPILPMLPTTPQRATHDYQRNGACDLFAALEVATGKVITDIRARHTSADFVAFLNKVNREVPTHLDVHVILDNLSTHSHPQSSAGRCATAGSLPLHPDLRVVDEPRRALVRSTHHQTSSPAPPTAASKNSPPTSTLGSPTGTTTPHRSCGTRPPSRSSNASPATAPPSTEIQPHDANHFNALKPSSRGTS
jgi:DDE superfamily endonuclease